MKITELVDYVREICDSGYSDETILHWVNQVEAEIQHDVLRRRPEDIVQYNIEDVEWETELIVPAPQSKLYEDYLMWRIHQAQGELELANNDADNYNAQRTSFAAAVARAEDAARERRRWYYGMRAQECGGDIDGT